MSYHVPALLNEAIEALNIKPNGIYVDVTYGGGGHSKAILNKLVNGKLVAFDQDTDAAKNVIDDKRLLFVNQNFRYLKKYLKVLGTFPVDGILADLGVSSHQFDTADRGFSFRFNSKLDMRMNASQGISASYVLNEYSEKQLQHLFSEYGEVRNAKTLAKAIIENRKVKKIETIEDLMAIAEPIAAGIKNKYLAQVFQALRIEVNEEIKVLEEFLLQTVDCLNSKGKLVVIAYHSLEDRMTKNLMKTGNPNGIIHKDLYGHYHQPFSIITKKPIEPNEEEIKMNSRARSAKMRVAEKI